MDTITITKKEFLSKSAEAIAEMFTKALDQGEMKAAMHLMLIFPLLTSILTDKLFDKDPETELAKAVEGEEK